MPSSKMDSTPTAAIVIIGDEILKGQIQDTNTLHLTKELHTCGIKVKKVVVIPDVIDEIAQEVLVLTQKFTYVFTSGGVGPTHDDVTFEAIAKAFNEDLIISSEIRKVLEQHFKEGDLNESVMKMAKVPKSAVVDYSKTGSKSFPVITLNNLFILPGVPNLLKKTFDVIRTDLFKLHAKQHQTVVKECFIKSSEFVITDQLNHLVKKYSQATFGSYPEWTHNYYETKLTIEADNEVLAEQIVKEIGENMDVISYDKCPEINANDKISKLLTKHQEDKSFVEKVQESQRVIEECFKKYSDNEIAIAFNGGKDCMALLHMTHALKQSQNKSKIQALYIRESDPFPKVEEFIDKCVTTYNLDLVTIQAPMKEALGSMLEQRPNIKAILMGTRQGDPGSKGQSHFSPTDGSWPRVMRVNPILHWDYHHVWIFLRGLTLPYPIYYDQGYTSLGGIHNTSPNPNLVQDDGLKAKPAYELEDGTLERAGRISKK